MDILTFPNKILTKEATEVTDFEQAREISKEMIEIATELNAFGLAGPQVGVSENILVWRTMKKDNQLTKFKTLINPQIKIARGAETDQEACLSLPGILVEVTRPTILKVAGLNENKKIVSFVARGLEARILSHEMDHLRGILLVDYLNDESFQLAVKEIAAAKLQDSIKK
jgi:peptide deformylase